MKVELLSYTPNSMDVIYAAYRQCYSSDTTMEPIIEGLKSNTNEYIISDKMMKTITNGMKSGHFSPLEHVNFTFRVSGVSRSLTHQLVRHRLASYSQQSQRYVDMTDNSYVIPTIIEKDSFIKKEYDKCMKTIFEAYEHIQGLLIEKGYDSEKANENARYVLPNACYTSIIFTMNCRSLLHFFEERCCSRAQEEIRILANIMRIKCAIKLPIVFDNAGPKCLRLKHCPEHKSCGFYERKKENESMSSKV